MRRRTGSHRFVKHYLIDFGATAPLSVVTACTQKTHDLAMNTFLRFGRDSFNSQVALYVPKYARVAYPENVAVGNFTSEAFDPDNWKSNYPNAAFENRLPGDEFWAAKQVMAFSDDEIRAIVQTGAYSDPQTPRQIAQILIARRDAIGGTFFSRVLPLDRFRIDSNRLTFDDLAAIHGLRTPGKYEVTWTRVNNAQPSELLSVAGSGPQIPAVAMSAQVGSYWAARIHDAAQVRSVKVFLRKEQSSWAVVGIEREGESAWKPR